MTKVARRQMMARAVAAVSAAYVAAWYASLATAEYLAAGWVDPCIGADDFLCAERPPGGGESALVFAAILLGSVAIYAGWEVRRSGRAGLPPLGRLAVYAAAAPFLVWAFCVLFIGGGAFVPVFLSVALPALIAVAAAHARPQVYLAVESVLFILFALVTVACALTWGDAFLDLSVLAVYLSCPVALLGAGLAAQAVEHREARRSEEPLVRPWEELML